jgi:phosphoribosylformimino-5-aminoimidazole carboxamide ribotide isomerase
MAQSEKRSDFLAWCRAAGVVPYPRMQIYPAIDIKGGRCVRLTQGRSDQETVYAEDPAVVAAAFQAAGSVWVHVVDLDGAFAGAPRNLAVVERIVALGLRVQCGGGLRTRATVEQMLGCGVSRVVVGTRAAESEAFVGELVQAFGNRIAVGIDARDGRVAVKGWIDTTGTGAVALGRRMDGMLEAVRCRVIASGGVSSPADVARLAEIKKRRPNLDGVIIGKALYEGRVDLKELLAQAG